MTDSRDYAGLPTWRFWLGVVALVVSLACAVFAPSGAAWAGVKVALFAVWIVLWWPAFVRELRARRYRGHHD